MNYSVQQAWESWSRVPVDDLGYFSPAELLILQDFQLRELIDLATQQRWHPAQWRNKDHALYNFMNPKSARGKIVMDFGCGLGLDAVQFMLSEANVILADMHPKGVYLAQQICIIATGIVPPRVCMVSPLSPYFIAPRFDVFWSMGVLHHTPYAKQIMKRAAEHLNPGGELRICLYSSKRWTDMMGEEPPEVVHEHPRFLEYVRRCDSVGIWADWYDEKKLSALVDEFAVVESCVSICDGQMIGAVIKPK